MANPYFTPSGVPTQRSNGVSSVIRQEIANIALGFDKLPAFSGNVGKLVAIGATALAASGAFSESGTNGTVAGNLTVVGNHSVQGNSALGDGATDTLSVSGSLIRGANGNWTLPAAASGDTLNVSALAGNFGIVQAQSMGGSTAKWQLRNTSGAASSAAQFSVEVGGTAAGDPVYQALITGGSTWTFGPDNSQADAFKWAAASALSDTAALAIETTGWIWGSSVHNNADAATGILKQPFGRSGTYTPATSNLSGLTSATPFAGTRWVRVGNMVIVTGLVDIVPNSTGAMQFDLTMPIANGANFSGFDGHGVVNVHGNTERTVGLVIPNTATTNRMQFTLPISVQENKGVRFFIMYEITS
jgi:hypothetical protein